MLFVFCDGACTGNGRAGAAAGFAAVFCGGPGGVGVVSGPVAAAEYALAADGWPAPVGGGRPAPTNNRAELLALAWALAALPRLGAAAATVVSDSLISVRTLNEWYPARCAAGKQDEMCNLDLIRAADAALAAARAAGVAVAIEHQRGHTPEPDRADLRAYLYWRGNDRADRAAGAAIAAPGVAASGEGPLRDALARLLS